MGDKGGAGDKALKGGILPVAPGACFVEWFLKARNMHQQNRFLHRFCTSGQMQTLDSYSGLRDMSRQVNSIQVSMTSLDFMSRHISGATCLTNLLDVACLYNTSYFDDTS